MFCLEKIGLTLYHFKKYQHFLWTCPHFRQKIHLIFLRPTWNSINQYCNAVMYLKLIRLFINFFRYEKKQEESSLHISHTVRNFEFFYEPFYISLDTAPPFDERFIGYGFTRNTQVGKILTLHIVLTKTLFRKSKTMKKKYFNFQKDENSLNLLQTWACIKISNWPNSNQL